MKKFRQFNNKYYKLFILLYVFQLIILIIFINNNYLQKYALFQSKYAEILDIIIGIVIFIFNILSILIIRYFLLNNLQEHENSINQLKLAHVLRENKIYRQSKHDLKNHLNVIYELAGDGDISKLQNYLTLYIDKLDSTALNINVGIKELDILIYSKITNARNLDIDVKFKCSTFFQFNNRYVIDLVSIIGNLLDNAIEACSELENGKKIEITLREDPVDYIIEITNTFKKRDDFEPKKIFEEGYSTKDKATRGEGLYIVQKTLKKLNGNINVNVENGNFLVEVEIPKHVLED
ncbi:MAG: sensor histidine kinase [Bacillota bacterium]